MRNIRNICGNPEYKNKGIGTSVLNDIIFVHREQNIKI